jgi:LAGLIDADG DNA endonuclease family
MKNNNNSDLTLIALEGLKQIKNDNLLTQTEKDIIVGTILGDGYLAVSKLVNNNISVSLKYGYANEEYANFVLGKLKNLCNYNIPSISENLDKRYNKTRVSYRFATRVHPSLNYFANLFLKPYFDETKCKYFFHKVIPDQDTLLNLITPRSLAFWIMDDGNQVERGGVTLCTDNFTPEEVTRLKYVLETKFKLVCTIHKKANKHKTKFYYRIYILRESLPLLSSLVSEFMLDSMKYKILFIFKEKIPLSLTKKNIKAREKLAEIKA